MAYHFYVSIILYLEAGATVIVSADYLAESILDAAAQHRATFLYMTPMHIRMLNSEKSGRALPPSLQARDVRFQQTASAVSAGFSCEV